MVQQQQQAQQQQQILAAIVHAQQVQGYNFSPVELAVLQQQMQQVHQRQQQ